MDNTRTKQYVTEKHTCKECGHTRTDMIPIEDYETDMSIQISSHKRGYQAQIDIASKKDIFPEGIYVFSQNIKGLFKELRQYLRLCETDKGVSIKSDNHSLVINKRVNDALLEEIRKSFSSSEESQERWFEPYYRKATRQHSRVKKS